MVTVDVDFSDVKLKALEQVNNPGKPTINLGVEELGDAVHGYYKGIETYNKVTENGKIGPEDFQPLFSLASLVPSIVSGANEIPLEAMDLTDQEIDALVAIGDQYKLGQAAPKYKAVLKALLVNVQTFSVFKNDPNID